MWNLIQVLIQMIRGEEVIWPKLLLIIQDITQTLKKGTYFVMIYHSSEGNKAANTIANEAFSFMNYVLKIYFIVPGWLKSTVETEKPRV